MLHNETRDGDSGAYESKAYWNIRGEEYYEYKGEMFYTVTPIPYYYRRRALLLDVITPYLADEDIDTVCDFGCGDGWYLRHFSDGFDRKRYYGVDLSDVMIERAGNVCPVAQLRVSNAGIPFDQAFDLIYSIAVFAHVEDEDVVPLFSSIYEKLERGGAVYPL